MTKKDYELIAGVFATEIQRLNSLLGFKTSRVGGISSFNEGGIDELQYIIKSFCYELQRENPKFDKDKFLTACGIKIN